jgi:hypothetical protein
VTLWRAAHEQAMGAVATDMKKIVLLACVLWADTGQADPFKPGPVHDLVAKVCTHCHVAAQVTAQHKSTAEWNKTVNQMINNGAQLRDEDVDKVVAYLAKNYGPIK